METKLHLRVNENITLVFFFTEACRFDVEIYLLIITIKFYGEMKLYVQQNSIWCQN